MTAFIKRVILDFISNSAENGCQELQLHLANLIGRSRAKKKSYITSVQDESNGSNFEK